MGRRGNYFVIRKKKRYYSVLGRRPVTVKEMILAQISRAFVYSVRHTGGLVSPCVRQGRGITCVYTPLRTVVLLVVCVTDWVTMVNIVRCWWRSEHALAGLLRPCEGLLSIYMLKICRVIKPAPSLLPPLFSLAIKTVRQTWRGRKRWDLVNGRWKVALGGD